MIYRSISKKHFAWLYNHVGKFKSTILICILLNVLAVASSLFFVQVTKIFMEAVEKGENFSFVVLAISPYLTNREDKKTSVAVITDDDIKIFDLDSGEVLMSLKF